MGWSRRNRGEDGHLFPVVIRAIVLRKPVPTDSAPNGRPRGFHQLCSAIGRRRRPWSCSGWRAFVQLHTFLFFVEKKIHLARASVSPKTCAQSFENWENETTFGSSPTVLSSSNQLLTIHHRGENWRGFIKNEGWMKKLMINNNNWWEIYVCRCNEQ